MPLWIAATGFVGNEGEPFVEGGGEFGFRRGHRISVLQKETQVKLELHTQFFASLRNGRSRKQDEC